MIHQGLQLVVELVNWLDRSPASPLSTTGSGRDTGGLLGPATLLMQTDHILTSQQINTPQVDTPHSIVPLISLI